MKRIKILDSFRGLAALIVVFHHVYFMFGYLYPGEAKMRIHRLLYFISDLNLMAVLFFFLLSGFSIRLSLKNGPPVNKSSLNEYLYRRFKRIVPLYYIALILTFICGLILCATANSDYSIKNLIGNLLFLQASKSYEGYWFPPYGNNGPLWSISFEMFYYLFFPVFLFVLLKVFRRERLGILQQRISLCIAFVLSIFCIVGNNFFFLPYMAFGRLFFIWYSGFCLANLYLERRMRINADLLLFIFLALLSGVLLYLKNSVSLYLSFSGSVIAIIFYILYIIRKSFSERLKSRMDRLFNFFFFHIGKGSYALYLLHYPLIVVLKSFKNMNMWIVMSSLFVLIFICTRLEEFFVRQKFGFLRIRYVGGAN